MTAKRKPELGEYMWICWEDEPDYELVYGHVDADTATAEVESATGMTSRAYETSHVWMRWVPDHSGVYDLRIHDAAPNSRGAFRATKVCRLAVKP